MALVHFRRLGKRNFDENDCTFTRTFETEAVFARLAFFLPVSGKDAGNPSRVNSNPSEFYRRETG
jgi:hypothetical protein